jgi:hypothetical protein
MLMPEGSGACAEEPIVIREKRPHMQIVERLRLNAARKSDFDADKQLMTDAANEIERLLDGVVEFVDHQIDMPARKHFEKLIKSTGR